MTSSASRQWIELTMAVPTELVESAAAWLWELGTSGVEERQQDGQVVLRAFFPGICGRSELAAEISRRISDSGSAIQLLDCREYEEDPQHWIENWRRNFRGFPVGERFYIHPPWEEPDPAYPWPLVVEPSRAFGTGTHESTQLCMLTLQEWAPRCSSLLDVGCGTGMLAAAARIANPRLRAAAFDNDPETGPVARRFLRDNGLQEVRHFIGEISSVGSRFDLVTANLTLAAFSEVGEEIMQKAQRWLLISGFTDDQSDRAQRAFTSTGRFRPAQERSMRGWACRLLERV